MRKKRRKKKHKENSNGHESDSASDEEKPKHRGWFFDYAQKPLPEQCKSDDEVIHKAFLCV